MTSERNAQTLPEDAVREFSGVKTLVTGGASFIGSHLVEMLCGAGADVTIVDDLSSGKLENIDSVASSVRVIRGDLRNPDVAAAASDKQELVFHLAASHGGRGYIDTHPVECMNNMVIDHNVFSAAATAGARKVTFASSACVYPTYLQSSSSERVLLSEEDAGFEGAGRAFADGEYGWAKLMGEMQLRAFHKQYGMEGVACRIFTAYGERENESHAVIALVAKALARLDPYPVWGDGTQTRNFTYVADTVRGMALSSAFAKGFEIMNVGSPTHVTINELIQEVFTILDWTPSHIDYQVDKPVGVLSRAADITKSEKLLEWFPQTPLTVGLINTIDWYKNAVTPERLAGLESLLMSR